MRIAMLTGWFYRWNGTSQVVKLLSEGLVQRGHKVKIFCSESDQGAWFDDRIKITTAPSNKWTKWKYLSKKIADFEPNIIHSHDSMGYYAMQTDRPHISTSHSNWPRAWFLSAEHIAAGFIQEIPHKIMLKNVDKVVSVSEYSRQQLESLFIDSQPIYNSVQVPDINVNSDRKFDFIYVGTIGPRKAKYLPQIWENILEINNEVKMAVVGHTASEKLKKIIAELPNIEMMGEVESVDPFLKKSNVLLFPSRAEACPLSILEAQAYGLPVIAFDVCSHTELIKSGISGETIEPYNTHAFAQSAIRQLDDISTEKRRRIINYAENQFSPNRMVDEYETTYKKIAR